MRFLKKGFTLIELLVVITLIGILAIAVLSALNPIEQINKARDAGKRSDAAQLLTAIDRYFASNEKFPWNNYDEYDTSVDLEFAGSADWVGVGVCGNGSTEDATATNSDSGGCADDSEGYLISTQELKSQFGKRDYFKDAGSVTEADRLYVYKALDDPSVSICFVPASKATRDTAGEANTSLKFLGDVSDGVPDSISVCDDVPESWSDLSEACFVCIPEE